MNDENDELMRSAVISAGYKLKEDNRGFSAEGIDVAWENVDEPNEVMIWCTVGDMPEEPKAEFMRYLLEVNCFGSVTAGGHLGLYSLAPVLIYSYRLVLDADGDVTSKVLQAFVAKALQLKGRLIDLQTLTDAEDEADEVEDSGDGMLPMASLRI